MTKIEKELLDPSISEQQKNFLKEDLEKWEKLFLHKKEKRMKAKKTQQSDNGG